MPGSLITDKVKQIVRMRGPLIPSQISKEIGTNILMASAILSDLTTHGEVKLSSIKVGGTPIYYVSGQEEKLQNFLSSLPPKEKEAFEKLKTSSVLSDSELEPAIRVALRQLKDFAKPIDVNINGEVSLFWKWYLLPNEGAEAAIRKFLGTTEEKAQAPVQAQVTQQPPLVDQPKPQQPTLQEAPIAPSVARKRQRAASPPQTGEVNTLAGSFFTKNGIAIESLILSKKSEAEYIVQLPSPVGQLRYYCVVKGKKTCTDSDLSAAIVQGQLRKLPVLFLVTGELSKKAQDILSQDIGAIVVKKI